mmetsp:Transcript_48401/g.112114  ORF Transcript_48401/g.112114 Transcript_48401/m.112114 type:complete len:211 (-) Transcript_48401:454-1086(-)
MEVSWKCHGSVMEVSRGRRGIVREVSGKFRAVGRRGWRCSRPAEVSRKCTGSVPLRVTSTRPSADSPKRWRGRGSGTPPTGASMTSTPTRARAATCPADCGRTRWWRSGGRADPRPSHRTRAGCSDSRERGTRPTRASRATARESARPHRRARPDGSQHRAPPKRLVSQRPADPRERTSSRSTAARARARGRPGRSAAPRRAASPAGREE